MKVRGKISQITVTGEISQVIVRGRVEQLIVTGEIEQQGTTHYPPVVVSVTGGELSPNQIDILFDKNLYMYPGLEELESMFSFSLSGGPAGITGVTIPGDGMVNKTAVITLDRSLVAGETGIVTYTPGADGLRDETDESAPVQAFTATIINMVE
jgi:hypothetical protein